MSYDKNGNRHTRLSRQNTFGENQQYSRDINLSSLRQTLSTRVIRRMEQPRQPFLPEIRLEQHTQRNNEQFPGNHYLIRRAETESNAHQFLTVKDFETTTRLHTNKVVKSQRSCESYDSAASGMSWSSSPSTSAMQMRGSEYHSNSMSSNHSVSGFEDTPFNERVEDTVNKAKNVDFTPSSVQRNTDEEYLSRNICPRSRKSGRPLFKTGFSFDEEAGVGLADSTELNSLRRSLEVTPTEQGKNTETDMNTIQATPECLEGLQSQQQRNSKTFWRKALNLIRVTKAFEGKNWKRLIKKRAEEEDRKSSSPEEIDPIYQLLKSAASQHKLLCGDVSTTVVNLQSTCDTGNQE